MSLNEKLKKYDLFLTLSKVAPLLTFPSLHVNLHRIESLIYLIISNCKRSNLSPTNNEIEVWLNKYLSRSEEDPIEDVFVTNIITPLGNYRIFEGLWASNDFHVQKTIEILYSQTDEYKKLLSYIFELLKLSDLIVEKSNLKRWDYSEKTKPKGDIKLPNKSDKAINRVIFNLKDLHSLGIRLEFLTPFLFKLEDITTLKIENYGYSELESKPLIYLRGRLIVALPNAIGSAIRNYVISEFKKTNSLNKLEKIFFEYEVNLLEKPVVSPIFRLISKNKIKHGITHSIPLLKDWLVKYDLDKYLHVILCHSPIDQTKSIYDVDERISEYIEKVFNFCKSQSNFKEGISVVVLGSDGLNTIGIKKGLEVNKSSWYTSFLPIYDFLKLSTSFDKNRSLKTYLKFLSQKKYSEINGMEYINIWGDYNLYCSWYLQDCNLISNNIPVNTIGTVFLLNKQIRKSADNHVSKDINGRYFPVTSYNVSSYFPSITNLPIYISLHHLFDKSILKVVIENKKILLSG